MDWTADYRMYSRERIDCERVFSEIRREICSLSGSKLLITALDDSLLAKTGKKIPGVKFARDPMGPPFQVNFVRGQRVIQMSAAISDGGQARMVPAMFRDASTPDKPGRGASMERWARYKEERKARRLSVCGTACIKEMRAHLEKDWGLWVGVDGSYTNRTVLNGLPSNTVLIGRIRSDARLYHLPAIADCGWAWPEEDLRGARAHTRASPCR